MIMNIYTKNKQSLVQYQSQYIQPIQPVQFVQPQYIYPIYPSYTTLS